MYMSCILILVLFDKHYILVFGSCSVILLIKFQRRILFDNFILIYGKQDDSLNPRKCIIYSN